MTIVPAAAAKVVQMATRKRKGVSTKGEDIVMDTIISLPLQVIIDLFFD